MRCFFGVCRRLDFPRWLTFVLPLRWMRWRWEFRRIFIVWFWRWLGCRCSSSCWSVIWRNYAIVPSGIPDVIIRWSVIDWRFSDVGPTPRKHQTWTSFSSPSSASLFLPVSLLPKGNNGNGNAPARVPLVPYSSQLYKNQWVIPSQIKNIYVSCSRSNLSLSALYRS